MLRLAPLLVLLVLLLLLTSGDAVAKTTTPSLEVDGKTRRYVLHVPDNLPKREVPLVLVFHGAGSSPASMVRATGLNAIADRHAFIVVYPYALGSFRSFNAGTYTGPFARSMPDDVKFTRLLVAHLCKTYAIDRRRIFATGFSNGAMLCYRLAAELSETFAAIAPVAGAMGTLVRAKPTSPVSVMHVHGTADRIVPPGGPAGLTKGFARYRSAPVSVRTWATFNGCATTPRPKPTRDTDAAPLKVTRTVYACPKGIGTELVLVEGAGHTWPRGRGNWTTRAILAFFRAHPKPRPPTAPAKAPPARKPPAAKGSKVAPDGAPRGR